MRLTYRNRLAGTDHGTDDQEPVEPTEPTEPTTREPGDSGWKEFWVGVILMMGIFLSGCIVGQWYERRQAVAARVACWELTDPILGKQTFKYLPPRSVEPRWLGAEKKRARP